MTTKIRALKFEDILTTPVRDALVKGSVGREFAVEPIVCADGTTLSVQASRLHYCEPRDNVGPWTAVEVGYMTAQPEPSWVRYRDGDDWRGIYGFVPVELVREHIKIHGGEAGA